LLLGAKTKEKEHVIPKILVRPDSLAEPLILTSCSKHNREKAFDEESVVTFLQGTSGDYSPQALKSFERTVEIGRKYLGQVLHPDGKPKHKSGAGILLQMSRSITEVDMYSQAGVYLGKYGKLPIDSERFKNFYLRIAKGFYTAAKGEIIDWSVFNIKILFGSHSYDKSVPDKVFLTPFQFPTHQDSWGKDVMISGHLGTNPEDLPYSIWSFGFFDEHKAVATFTHKGIKLPSAPDSDTLKG